MQYLIILIYLFLNFSQSHDYKNNGIEVIRPVLKMVTENGKMGAGYFTIVNNTADIITLNGITSNIAKKQEIHEVILENDTYKMRPVKNGLSIKPGESLVFKSKSYHVMFFNINNTHKTNEMLQATLQFDKKVSIKIMFKVLISNTSHNQ